jgi:hypothetical protein
LWNPFAGANWITSSPTRKTIRSKASNGEMGSSAAARTIPPSSNLRLRAEGGSLDLNFRGSNSCSLKYDELDLKLRDMLESSGIEPKATAQEAAVAEA